MGFSEIDERNVHVYFVYFQRAAHQAVRVCCKSVFVFSVSFLLLLNIDFQRQTEIVQLDRAVGCFKLDARNSLGLTL